MSRLWCAALIHQKYPKDSVGGWPPTASITQQWNLLCNNNPQCGSLPYNNQNLDFRFPWLLSSLFVLRQKSTFHTPFMLPSPGSKSIACFAKTCVLFQVEVLSVMSLSLSLSVVSLDCMDPSPPAVLLSKSYSHSCQGKQENTRGCQFRTLQTS